MISLHSILARASGPESHKYFLGDTGQRIDSVCVIASYYKMSGVGIGPDGKGRHPSTERYLIKPFRYLPKENFYAKLVPNETTVVPIPPFFAMGEAYSVAQILFMHRGYAPFRLRGDYDSRTETITLKSDGTHLAESVANALLKREVGSPVLQKYFLMDDGQLSGSLVIDYTTEDDDLLRTCLLDSKETK